MNPSHNYKRREIPMRLLLYRTLRRWRLILIIALIAAAAGAAFKAAQKSGGGNVSPEAEAAYQRELSVYEQSKAAYPLVLENADNLLSSTRAYLAGSLLMKTDPAHTGKAHALVTLVPASSSGNAPAAGQLADCYASFIAYGIDYAPLSESLGTSPEYLAELVTTVPSVSGGASYISANAVSVPSVSDGTLSVTVVHPDADTAAVILGEVLKQLQEYAPSASEKYGSHEVIVGDIRSGYYTDILNGGVSEAIMQDMYALTTNREYLTEQYESLSAPSRPGNSSGTGRVKRAVKGAVLGFIAGLFLSVLAVMIYLTLCGRVLSGTELSQIYGLRKLAVIPDERVRGAFPDRLVESLDTEQKNGASRESRFILAAEAIAAAGPVSSVVLTGNVDAADLASCRDALSNAAASTGKAFADDIYTADISAMSADDLSAVRGADCVVLVERIEGSEHARVEEAVAALWAVKAEVAGVIVV